MKSFASRLDEALAIRKMSAAELSRRIGVYEATISNYRKGKYEPKQDRLEEIADVLNVSIAWLMGADVPMKKEAPTSESVLTDYELEVIKLLRTVPEDKREDFLNYLQAAVNMLK